MQSAFDTRRQFLQASLGVAGVAATANISIGRTTASKPLMAYVGTFSSPLTDVLPTQVDLPAGNGRGIHLFHVDRESGALTAAGEVRMGTSPSCLVLNSDGTRIYSANETDRYEGTKEGTVSAFEVLPDGKLKLLNSVRSGGAGPTYVSIHPSGKFLLVANYFGGSVAVVPIRADGSLAEPSDVKEDSGPIGPTRATNAPPGSFAFSGHDRTHAHMIQADPSGQFVLHVDLGTDQILIWKFDASTGKLAPASPPAVSLPPGDGPRHFHFHPNGKWFYSIQEEGATVVLFDYDGAKGQLTARQTISSLPPDMPEAASAQRFLSRRTDVSFTLVTDCTTVSASFPSGLTERSHLLVTSGLAATIREASISIPPVGSCTAAISEQTMSPCSKSIRNPAG